MLSLAYLRCKVKRRKIATSSSRKRRFWQRDIFKKHHLSQYCNLFQELRQSDREYHFRFVYFNKIHFCTVIYLNLFLTFINEPKIIFGGPGVSPGGGGIDQKITKSTPPGGGALFDQIFGQGHILDQFLACFCNFEVLFYSFFK